MEGETYNSPVGSVPLPDILVDVGLVGAGGLGFDNELGYLGGGQLLSGDGGVVVEEEFDKLEGDTKGNIYRGEKEKMGMGGEKNKYEKERGGRGRGGRGEGMCVCDIYIYIYIYIERERERDREEGRGRYI